MGTCRKFGTNQAYPPIRAQTPVGLQPSSSSAHFQKLLGTKGLGVEKGPGIGGLDRHALVSSLSAALRGIFFQTLREDLASSPPRLFPYTFRQLSVAPELHRLCRAICVIVLPHSISHTTHCKKPCELQTEKNGSHHWRRCFVSPFHPLKKRQLQLIFSLPRHKLALWISCWRGLQVGSIWMPYSPQNSVQDDFFDLANEQKHNIS